MSPLKKRKWVIGEVYNENNQEFPAQLEVFS